MNKIIIPEDFDPEIYKKINKDLIFLSNDELIHHYINWGKNEGRPYKIAKPPHDFNPENYKKINEDLREMTDEDATNHYINWGKYEGRCYKLINYDNNVIYQNKYKNNCIFMVNHHESFAGATVFLYDLAVYLEKNKYFDNVIVVDVCENEIVKNIYHTDLKIKPLFHQNDNNLMLKFIEDLNPIFIYSNSLNIILKNINVYEYCIHKIIFHFHETINMIKQSNNIFFENINLINKHQKIFVVSESIKNEFEQKFNFSNIHVFHPFIPKHKLNNLEKQFHEQIDQIIVDQINKNKKTIGMCGVDLKRKGFNLFYDCAKNMPEFNFIWIGGYSQKNSCLKNFIHIKNTKNPYKYFKLIDLFLMTSEEDPCPIVLLEAMYFNINCLVLDKNITYEHNIEGYYKLKNHENNHNNIVNYLTTLQINKPNNNELCKYIINNFTCPKIINYIKKKSNLLLNLSLHGDINISYYKNIINYYKIVTNNDVNIMICYKLNKNLFNNDYNYYHHCCNEWDIITFGINYYDCYKEINEIVEKFKKEKICYDYFIFTPNIGYDFGSLLISLNYDNVHNNYEYITVVHSKSNLAWRNILFEILNYDIRNYQNIDTIVTNIFYNKFDKETDNNFEILTSNDLFHFESHDFFYNGGKVFSTLMSNLHFFINNFKNIFEMCTCINKNDTYWIKIMNDEILFNKYVKQYENCPFNKPIDAHAKNILINKSAINYIDLLVNHNTRGIPDCQFEHAMERYIGYLTTYKKNVMKV